MPPTPPLPATDDFDALADLFLTDDPPRADSSPAPGQKRATPRPNTCRRPMLELLVQGHLPVRAAPWASQYARERAAAIEEVVALVRHGQDHLSVELFGETEEVAAAFDRESDALRHAADRAALVILQLDEVHQAAAAADPRLKAVTVLAGANEAAVVAAYRTLKGLASVLAPASSAEDDPLTDLQVALVSVDRAEAGDALDRLRRAVAVFLDRPLRLACTIERIAPTGARSLYRGESALGPVEVLERLTAPRDARMDCSHQRRESSPAAHAVAPVAETSLASLVEGLVLLHFGPPEDPSVEIAADRAGVLHLLCADDDGKGVGRLVAAEAWAMKHRPLLSAAAGPDARIDQSKPVVLHLFTDSPKSVRHLLDADLRVHAIITPGNGARSIELN